MFSVIKTQKGKDTVIMTDTRSKCNDRIKTLRSSYRGRSDIKLRIEEDDGEKYRKPPHDGSYRSGDYAKTPKIVR